MVTENPAERLGAEDLLQGLPGRLHHVLAPHVTQRPDAPAIVEGDTTWTYRGLADAVAAVARDLVALGIRSGDRVMLVSENCAALAAGVFAASTLDAWPIVTSPRLSPREVDLIKTHSGARRQVFMAGISPEAAVQAERCQAAPVSFGPFAGIAAGALDEAAVAEPVHADPARQVAALIYTSGTTGAPKGVMLSHRNLLFSAKVTGLLRRMGRDDRVYGVLPMSHIVGLSSSLVGTLMYGGCLMPVPRADPAHLAAALASGGVTVLSGVPATYQRLLAHKATAKLDRLDAGRLSRASVAGAPLDPALKRRVEEELGVSLSNAFGITECSPTIAMVRLEDPRPDETVGRVLPGVEVRLVKGDGALAGDGEIGELHVRGPNVMLGYYRAPDLTAAAVDGDGWFRSGDLARSSDGFLYIVGRLKEMIIRSGFNVYPAEIEAVLNGHPAVVQSAVVGRAIDANEEVVAFVQLLPGAGATVADVRAYVEPLLTAYKRPSRIIALDAFPAGSTGKILKHVLKDRAAALPPEGASGEA